MPDTDSTKPRFETPDGLSDGRRIEGSLDQRIAQLAIDARDPGSESPVRKLIRVRYRQQ